MQLERLVPHSDAGISAQAYIERFDIAALIRGLADNGFRLIELGGDLSLFFPNVFSPDAVDQLAALRSEYGIQYTVHLPLWSVEPSTSFEPVRMGSVNVITEVIRATLPLAPEVYVLHATGALAAEFSRMHLPDVVRSAVVRQFQHQARRSLEEILADTGIASRQLAIETIEFPFELTLDLAELLDLGICFDTGHVLAGFSGAVDLFDALTACLPRLAEVHLHDARWQGPEQRIGYGTDHRTLGQGDLDSGRLLDVLAASHYEGPIIFELSVQQTHESLDLLRTIRPDFVRASTL